MELSRWVAGLSAAAACLLLTSCEASFDEQDRAFSRATQQRLAGEFQQQAAMLSAAEKQMADVGRASPIPPDFAPWWGAATAAKIFDDSEPNSQPLDDLLARALRQSSQIKVFSDIPLIRETGIQEARGRFDTHVFAEAAYEYLNEPVGHLLKTGGPNRFEQWESRLEAGLRRKMETGADVTLSQRIARTNNNSLFFVPNPQATATLALTVIQPLMRGGGIEYNRSYIRIAKLDSEIARQEFIRQAEAHLLELSRSYWNLYLTRATCLQKAKLAKDTAEVVAKLEKRSDIDAMQSELQRAKAALAKRRADLVRAEMGVKNAEDRIKALVNDPTLLPSARTELLPADAPSLRELTVSMKDAAAAALENRPEIAQAFLQIRAAAVRQEMSKNELLPQLDLILSTSLNGLDRAGRITDGWDEQWRDGTHPGFLVGLKFDYPIENNAAEARHRRRRIEMRQQLAQLQTTVDTVLLEVKISARELATSYREMLSRHESLAAAQEDLRTLEKRWESHAGGESKPAIGYLQLLIDAQERLAQAEEDFARSAVIYNVAMVHLQRAQGTLLKYEDLVIVRDEDDDDLPVLRLEKQAPTAEPTTAPAPKAEGAD